MQIRPHLMFNGRADEAAAFYARSLGAETIQRMTYADAPDPPPPGMIAAGWATKVMHMALKIGSVERFASDGMGPGPTFFSQAFGMRVDRFGVGWMVLAEG